MEKNHYKILIVLLFLFLGGILGKMYLNKADENKELIDVLSQTEVQLKTWKNENEESLAKIGVLQTNSTKNLLLVESKDATIKSLQETIKENEKLLSDKGSAAVIITETVIDIKADTETTVVNESPVYNSVFKDEWAEVITKADKDYTSVNIRTFHELSLVIGYESPGFLKKKIPYAIAKDKNKYSNIKDMRVYDIVTPVKKIVVGPYIGYGLTKVAQEVNIGWQVGFGVTYKLIEF